MESNVAGIVGSEELEIARLKAKANKLIDINKQLVRERDQLKRTIQRLQGFKYAEGGYGDSDEDELIFIYIKRVFRFIAELKNSALWLDYKNNTANTKEYYRIDKCDVENMLATYADEIVSERHLIDFMVNLGIMKSIGSKEIFSVLVDGKSRRVYMVRKTAVELTGVDI